MPIDLLAQSAALFCPNAVLSELNRYAHLIIISINQMIHNIVYHLVDKNHASGTEQLSLM